MFRAVPDRGSIVDVTTAESLEFTFNPEEISELDGAEWAKQKVQGVHHPRLQYGSGRGRQVSLVLRLYGPHKNKTVRQQVNWLRSLAYPDLEIDAVPHRPPHRVILNLGNLYRRETWVVEDVNVEWGQFTPDLEPITAVVKLTLTEHRVAAVGFREVRDN